MVICKWCNDRLPLVAPSTCSCRSLSLVLINNKIRIIANLEDIEIDFVETHPPEHFRDKAQGE
jgi:hypothetical protein